MDSINIVTGTMFGEKTNTVCDFYIGNDVARRFVPKKTICHAKP